MSAPTTLPTEAELASPLWGPRANFRELLARSATFQAWVGATGTDEEKRATARGHIYQTGLDGPEVVAARPFAMLFCDDDWRREADGPGALGLPGGGIGLIFEADVPAELADTHDAEKWLSLKVGACITEMEADTASAHQLINMSISLNGVPERADISITEEEGDFIAVGFTIGWGF